ncbi:ATP-dependent DNA helicase RecG, partial [Candidatus Dojkabacteria bacterium]|nr:ATP-dependent DNA helicase RecG [Candidatus Dojkabacteria bacterium]
DKLGIRTIRDLLTHFPRYHKDTSLITKIVDINEAGVEYTIKAFPKSVTNVRLRGARTLQKSTLSDETGNITVNWFNQPYLVKALSPEREYLFTGRAKENRGQVNFYPNSYEQVTVGQDSIHLGRISPQYPLTTGLPINWLRNRIRSLLDWLPQITDLEDELTAEEGFTPLFDALNQIHFPESEEQIAQARGRLSLMELTQLQLELIARRASKKQGRAPAFETAEKEISAFIARLPFELTADQHSAVSHVLFDLQDQKPMNRLLQGDVGSGKTIVAVVATLAAKLANFQTVILAPTTILAEQHFQSFSRLLKDQEISIELVTGSRKQSESADVLIGTSAVLARQSSLVRNLGLVIVDEQHRFGVGQREELLQPIMQASRQQPHFLNMTATPIPRTMALAMFGDLEISNIFTKPAGRLPIQTHLVPAQKVENSYAWVARHVEAGGQAFWMCPLVEESEKLAAKSAKQTYDRLSKEVFPGLQIGLLHGQMKPGEKEEVMQDFKLGKIDILVSTSVIEVGIDVPNATIMIIENAERFGLAQLHQIRGRVGRGDQQSWCFLFAGEDVSLEATQRLEFFASHDSGLEIAEFDLQNRGPGEVYGLKQSGIPNLKIANILDLAQVSRSREIAAGLWERGIKQVSLFAENTLPKT